MAFSEKQVIEQAIQIISNPKMLERKEALEAMSEEDRLLVQAAIADGKKEAERIKRTGEQNILPEVKKLSAEKQMLIVPQLKEILSMFEAAKLSSELVIIVKAATASWQQILNEAVHKTLEAAGLGALVVGGGAAAISSEFVKIIKGEEIKAGVLLNARELQTRFQTYLPSGTYCSTSTQGRATVFSLKQNGEHCTATIIPEAEDTVVKIEGVGLLALAKEAGSVLGILADSVDGADNAVEAAAGLFTNAGRIKRRAEDLRGTVAFPKRVAAVISAYINELHRAQDVAQGKISKELATLQEVKLKGTVCVACGVGRTEGVTLCSQCGYAYDGPMLSGAKLEQIEAQIKNLEGQLQ